MAKIKIVMKKYIEVARKGHSIFNFLTLSYLFIARELQKTADEYTHTTPSQPPPGQGEEPFRNSKFIEGLQNGQIGGFAPFPQISGWLVLVTRSRSYRCFLQRAGQGECARPDRWRACPRAPSP